MARCPGVELLVAAALSAGLGSPAAAQGGWRQWDVYLRDGTRVEANPLGAPDRAHLSLSIAAFEGRETAIPRSRIDYIAARTAAGPDLEPLSGVTLPPAPTGRVCQDLVVRRDGRRSAGPVMLEHIRYSEGMVRQGGAGIELQDIAYIKFASRRPCAQ